MGAAKFSRSAGSNETSGARDELIKRKGDANMENLLKWTGQCICTRTLIAFGR